MFNIVNYENRCVYIGTFKVNRNVVMWEGKVKHVEEKIKLWKKTREYKDIADFSAEQIFIEQPVKPKVRLIGIPLLLKPDIFVSLRNPRKDYPQ